MTEKQQNVINRANELIHFIEWKEVTRGEGLPVKWKCPFMKNLSDAVSEELKDRASNMETSGIQ